MKGTCVAPTLYVESSIVSYLRARPSGHVISAARQLVTQRWWQQERQNYQLFTSDYVIIEISRGDRILASDRINTVTGIPTLAITPEIPTLATELLRHHVLPEIARLDALHIATATVHQLDYLLTWNCTHIANERILPGVRNVIRALGYRMPVVCTPEELLDDEYPIT